MSLHYTEQGNLTGEAILYLHGSGMAGWSWQDVISRLPQYHNIAVDLPGHGASHTIQAQTLNDMAQSVADFIVETIPNRKVHIVGLSLGGIITLELLRYRPDLVTSAVVSGVNAIPLPFMTKLMVQLMMPLMKNDFFIRQNASMFQLDDESSALYFDSMKQLDMTTLKSIMPEIVNYSPAEQLRGIHVPILFVAGNEEQNINVESVALLANAMEQAVGVLAPNMHHGWSGENPVLFAEMIKKWIANKEIASGLDVMVDKHQQLVSG
ncbi:MAG: alpha/beta hydrolase [Chloroflexota bacterium]